jgi:hypothetical protein
VGLLFLLLGGGDCLHLVLLLLLGLLQVLEPDMVGRKRCRAPYRTVLLRPRPIFCLGGLLIAGVGERFPRRRLVVELHSTDDMLSLHKLPAALALAQILVLGHGLLNQRHRCLHHRLLALDPEQPNGNRIRPECITTNNQQMSPSLLLQHRKRELRGVEGS